MNENNRECNWCGSNRELIQHHASYRPEITITLCKQCHTSRHIKYGKCMLCKQRGLNHLYFACVDPKSGLSYWDSITHPITGNLNHPWPENGKWVLICEDCREKAIGLFVTLPRGKRRIDENLARWIQNKWNIDLERAKEKWRAIKGKTRLVTESSG